MTKQTLVSALYAFAAGLTTGPTITCCAKHNTVPVWT